MAGNYVRAIRSSGVSIYDSEHDHPELFVPSEKLERILNTALVGERLDFKLRTRSKVAKSLICKALGYPIPKSFKKVKPRFSGQNFDTYVQKRNNLQVWNEDVSPSRRYVLIHLDESDVVTKIRVVGGEVLADLDTTGKLTQKYQARSRARVTESKLVSALDTDTAQRTMRVDARFASMLPIEQIFNRLSVLVGSTVRNLGRDQERNRGGELHKAISRTLGQAHFADSGQFPDIPAQLLEVKLQTSPTIDLGLVSPDGTGQLSDFPELRHRDVRYGVFYGSLIGEEVRLEHLVVSTGADFFTFFQRFGGKVLNKKLQLHLPRDFFD